MKSINFQDLCSTNYINTFVFRLHFVSKSFYFIFFYLLFFSTFLLSLKTRPLIVRAGSSSLLTRTQTRGDYEANELQVARKSSLIVKFGLVKFNGRMNNEIPSMPWRYLFKYFYGARRGNGGSRVSINFWIMNSSRSLIAIVINGRKHRRPSFHETLK